MKFAINTPNFHIFADPRVLADLAREAEAAGWDGFFIWDNIGADWPLPFGDSWISLAAMAVATTRIRLGPVITALPRTRPWALARRAVALDHLSGGRLTLGVGLGDDGIREYSAYGSPPDNKLHGEMLDEGLAILTRLWSGEKFSFDGQHYHLTDVQYLPPPLQQPRIPIWVAAKWPNKKPFRRAARWDGVAPSGLAGDLTLAEYAAMMAFIRENRTTNAPFDALASGRTSGVDHPADRAIVIPFAELGATWWNEGFDWNYTVDEVRDRIRRGPPRL